MTLLFVESFEHETAAGIANKWSTSASMATPSTTNGRNGKGLNLSNSANAVKQCAPSDEHATMIVGMAIRIPSYRGDSFGAIITFASDDRQTNHITFCFDATGKIVIKLGAYNGTVLATSAASVTALNTWHFYEFKVTLADSGGLAECRVDGVTTPVVTFTGDTKNGGTKTVLDSVIFNISNNIMTNTSIDDLYWLNAAGSVNTAYLGDVQVECLFPTADGANTGLTPNSGSAHFSRVNETTEDTTTYVASSTLNNLDTNVMGDLATAAGTVYGVQVTNYAQKDITGARNIAPVIRQGGTNYAGSDKAVGVGFQFLSQVWEQDPNTSAAWTVAGVNSAEIGAKVR